MAAVALRRPSAPRSTEKQPDRPPADWPPIVIHCDNGRDWTLSGRDVVNRRFPAFEEALDGARDVEGEGAETAMVEVWQAGQYICRVPLGDGRQGVEPIRRPKDRGYAFGTSEQYANRVGEIIFATAGPLFWLALVLVAVDASLGWRLLSF